MHLRIFVKESLYYRNFPLFPFRIVKQKHHALIVTFRVERSARNDVISVVVFFAQTNAMNRVKSMRFVSIMFRM